MEEMNQAQDTNFEPQEVPYVLLKAVMEYINSKDLRPQPSLEPGAADTKPMNDPGNGSPEPGTGYNFSGMTKSMEQFWTGIMSMAEIGNGNLDKTEELKKLTGQITKGWFDFYEKECSRFLNIPQLGLTRYYQERAAHAVDKFNCFQIALTKFVGLLCEPAASSIQFWQEGVDPAGNKDKGSDFKARYQSWIQKLESVYLGLLKSPQYSSAMSNVLKALRDYKVSKELVLIDMLQELPIPTHKDMDELYKELYTLKKRVKELEKRGKKNG
jgi:hypothetical protein